MKIADKIFNQPGLSLLFLTSLMLMVLNIPRAEAAGKVSITFDDGFASTFENALPVLKQHNLVGTVYVTSGFIGNRGFMNWDQVLKLKNTYGWEIGGHTVQHEELPELDSSGIANEVNDSLDTLRSLGLNTVSFASPFGAYDSRVLVEVLKRYHSHRGFWDRDDLNSPPYQRDVLMVQSVERGVSSATVKSWVDQAINEDKWLILVYHEILPQEEHDPNYEYTNTIDELTEVLKYVKSSGIQVVTPNHTLRNQGNNLLENGSFNKGINQGWTVGDFDRVFIDGRNNGSYPSSRNSVTFEAGNTATHLFSENIAIQNSNTEYSFSVFVNTDNISRGEVGFYIDEYDSNDNWISGQWVGDVPPKKVTYYNFSYRPSSSRVKSFSWQTYTGDANDGRVFLDNYKVHK